jgi:hypothetical protein
MADAEREESLIQMGDNGEFSMPNADNGIDIIGEVNIEESVKQDTLSSRLVRHNGEGILLPNIVIDIRGLSDVKVSSYALNSLTAIERKDGDVNVYLMTDKTIEKVMKTKEELKEVVVIAMKSLVSQDISVYENMGNGKPARKIGGSSIRSMRLRL